MTRPTELTMPVLVHLPNGDRRGFHERWRSMVVWKELAAADDLDEFLSSEGWWWAHAHESEVEFEPRGLEPGEVIP